MKTYDSKLIILRGNSGSGKSTIAKHLREVSGHKIAIVEQDYLRRFVLKEKEKEGANNIDLIYRTVIFALSRNYDVVLEGISYFPRYGKMLQKLVQACPNNYVYYFDVSVEETIKRHVTKINAHEFGETQLREWYRHQDLTNFDTEVIIPESSSFEETVEQIVKETGI